MEKNSRGKEKASGTKAFSCPFTQPWLIGSYFLPRILFLHLHLSEMTDDTIYQVSVIPFIVVSPVTYTEIVFWRYAGTEIHQTQLWKHCKIVFQLSITQLLKKFWLEANNNHSFKERYSKFLQISKGLICIEKKKKKSFFHY